MNEKNSRILVTGSCGSVGSALVERLLYEGHIVCAFDNSENGLFLLDQKLKPQYPETYKSFLGDVRSEERLQLAMNGVSLVFHCAALKHVYISEYNPFEAMQTNIIGVNNVIKAAINSEVDRVILTSSDKAVNPTSTMGATKLLGERLFIAANYFTGKYKTKFSCVRFGNILNSNGSVLQIFRKQISENKPLTRTSIEMTRFIISMDHALDLCINSASRMLGGEIFVLSMGSCNILSLARAIIGREDFDFNVIGLKPGEKIYEELITESEAPRTLRDENLYVIIPDSLEMLSTEIKEKYANYKTFSQISGSLRSDVVTLDDNSVKTLLSDLKIL
jgi:UDP-N-acetylglucosamine 4,6-dehydratase